MLTFLDLQNECKRRAIRNQAGTEYDTAVKNAINFSLFRIAREAKWRSLRRKTYFDTVSSYTSGTNFVSVTNSSTAVSLISTACNLWTDKIKIDRYVKFGADSWYYKIRAINSNTNFVIDIPFRGSTTTNTSYEILPQDEYNLPIQVDHRAFLWHEDFGYPYQIHFIPDQDFFDTRVNLTDKNTPTHYRMWGEDTIMSQVPTSTPLLIVSSSGTDTSTQVSVFGNISGYPYFETVTLSGATTTKTAYEFESVERIAKDSSTVGRITITSSRGSYTIAVLPAGNTTATIKYSKVQLYPLPTHNFPINVYYYKDPYRLVNDDDIHELGGEFDEAIILLAVSKIKSEESQTEGAIFYKLYEDELSNLKKTNVDKLDWLPVLKRPNQERLDPFVVKNLLYRQAGGSYGPSSRL